MAEIKAADIAKLRNITGAGMMDCKQALTEAEGDTNKAIDILREKGKKVANKRADREALEGAVLSKVATSGKNAALIVLNCETDFVAKNADFVGLADKILTAAVEANAQTIEEVLALSIDGKSVAETIEFQTGVIGEKIEISNFFAIAAEACVAYIHTGNRLATLAGFSKEADNQVKRDVAMQIASMDPVAIDASDVPAETLEHEKKIALEIARGEGKPEAILDKIAEGRVKKFIEESTLMNQAFVKDSKKTIKAYLNSVDKDLTVTVFKRYSLNA